MAAMPASAHCIGISPPQVERKRTVRCGSAYAGSANVPPTMRTPVMAALLAAGFCALEILAIAQAPSPAPSAIADRSPTPNAAPKTQFDSDVRDLGRVVEGQVVRADFTIMNVGDAVLEISEVRPTCGCTTADKWDRRIEPGRSGVIPLQFNSAGYLGPVTKTVTVVCNDLARSNLVLQIKALVWKPITVTPAAMYFVLTRDSQTNEIRIARITNNDEEQSLVLSPPVSDQRVFRAEIRTNQPGKEYELVVGLVPPLTGSNITGSITIATSSTKTPALRVPAVAIIQPPVTALPAQLVLPAAPLDAKRELGVYIRNNESTPITVFEPKISLSNVQAQVHEFQKGRFFRVVLDFPAGFQLAPDQPGQLTVKTSNPQVPVLQIPIVRAAQPAPSPANVLAPPISSVARALTRTNQRPLVPDSSSARPSPRREN